MLCSRRYLTVSVHPPIFCPLIITWGNVASPPNSSVKANLSKCSFSLYSTYLNFFNVSISTNLIDQPFPKICKKIEIKIIENKDNFSEKEWKNLYKLSEETFVEETDSLKQGAAGAGLTDND